MPPMIPRLSVPEISPNLPEDTRRYASDTAFGANIGEAVAGLGKQISSIGNTLGEQVLKMQQRVNQADADQATTDYIVAQAELDNQFRSLEGKAQSQALPKYMQDTKTLREKFRGSLGNEDARHLYDSETRRYMGYSIRNGATSAATELKKYTTQSNTRLVETAAQGAIANPANDAAFSDNLGLAKRAVRQEAEARGWTPEEIADRETKVESDFWKKRLEVLADSEPEKASELLEANKDKMLPTEYLQVKNRIDAGKHAAGSVAALKAYGTKQAVEADFQSIMQTGVGNDRLDEKTVATVLGKQAARDFSNNRVYASSIFQATNAAPTMTREEMQGVLTGMTPKPGSESYDKELEAFNFVKKRYDDLIAMRQTDPAMAVSGDPAVKAAQAAMAKDKNYIGPLMTARLSAQEKAGVPVALRSPITLMEAQEISQPVLTALPGQERQAIEGAIKIAKDKYADKWQDAFNFAMRAQKISASIGQSVATTLRRASTGQTAQDRAQADVAIETDTASRAVAPITGMEEPIVRRPVQTEKIPMSKKILDKLPPIEAR